MAIHPDGKPAFYRRLDLWFGVVGVFGVIFAIYAFISTNKTGRISYAIETQKVFDPNNLSGFTLVTPKKIAVDRPVYATELVIWNSGSLSLSEASDRVREPLKITFANSTIYYHIISAHNLVDDENYEISDSPDKSAITLKWKFFDPGQGVRITVVHSEATEPNVIFSGRFFETTLSDEKLKSQPKDQKRFEKIFEVLNVILGCFAIVIGVSFFAFKRKLYPRTTTAFTIVNGMMIATGIILLVITLLHGLAATPPV